MGEGQQSCLGAAGENFEKKMLFTQGISSFMIIFLEKIAYL